ncbi:MAG: hypothetical protein CMF62_09560 [Magnetococcales bacterium]|nr:hypothetical protein [Magnetococcales bacterium]
MRFNILMLMFFLLVAAGVIAGGFVWGYLIGSLITLPFALATCVYKALGHFKGSTIPRVYAFWGATLTTVHFAINAKIGYTVDVMGFFFVMGAFALFTGFWAAKHARKMTSYFDKAATKV